MASVDALPSVGRGDQQRTNVKWESGHTIDDRPHILSEAVHNLKVLHRRRADLI